MLHLDTVPTFDELSANIISLVESVPDASREGISIVLRLRGQLGTCARRKQEMYLDDALRRMVACGRLQCSEYGYSA